MRRRSLLGVLGGATAGWFGATVLSSADGSADGPTEPSTATTPSTTSSTPTNTGTTVPAESRLATRTPEPTTVERTSTRTSSSATPESTQTGTPAADRRKVDTDATGHSSSPDERYTVLYTVTNEHSFPVRVTFEASVRLRNGSTLRKERTAELDAGGVVNSSFEFEGYDSTATGWSFGLVSVERVA